MGNRFADYRRGIETGVMQSATPNAMLDCLDEIDKLRDALAPFAAVAKGIPANWPAECKLRIDSLPDGSEYLAYHGFSCASNGTLPTIAEWREAANAAERE